MRDKIITLCGSTRFKPEFEKADRELTFRGYLVFSIGGTFTKFEKGHIRRKILKHETMICRVHKRKIRKSCAIFVVDGKEGYTGKHTNSEIRLAEKLGIPVFYWSKGDLKMLINKKFSRVLANVIETARARRDEGAI